MNYFKCSICGIYHDDGDPVNRICAMCILRVHEYKRKIKKNRPKGR